MEDTSIQVLRDRMEIIDVVIRFASALDMKDWKLCLSCFTDEIEADYSDLRGEPAKLIKSTDFVKLREIALSSLITEHLSTNHTITVEGDEATCISHMTIYRFLPSVEVREHFDTHCYYTHTLARTPQGWKIKKIKQSVLWSTGNPKIHAGVRDNRESD